MKQLFIEGDVGTGKSEMLRSVLAGFLADVGGFYVQRLCKGGRTKAFVLKSLLEEPEINLQAEFDELREWEQAFLLADEKGCWHAKKEIFETYGVACLQKSVEENKRLILLDEIGGIELSCPHFAKALCQLLNGSIPLLGVIKSSVNLDKLNSHLAAGEERMVSPPILEVIRNCPETKIIQMTKANRVLVQAQVERFIHAAMMRVVIHNE